MSVGSKCLACSYCVMNARQQCQAQCMLKDKTEVTSVESRLMIPLIPSDSISHLQLSLQVAPEVVPI